MRQLPSPYQTSHFLDNSSHDFTAITQNKIVIMYNWLYNEVKYLLKHVAETLFRSVYVSSQESTSQERITLLILRGYSHSSWPCRLSASLTPSCLRHAGPLYVSRKLLMETRDGKITELQNSVGWKGP